MLLEFQPFALQNIHHCCHTLKKKAMELNNMQIHPISISLLFEQIATTCVQVCYWEAYDDIRILCTGDNI